MAKKFHTRETGIDDVKRAMKNARTFPFAGDEFAEEHKKVYQSRPGSDKQAKDVNLPVEKKPKSPGNGAGSRVVVDDVPAPKKKIRSGESVYNRAKDDARVSQVLDHERYRDRDEERTRAVASGKITKKQSREEDWDDVLQHRRIHPSHPPEIEKNVWHSPDAKDTNLPVEKKKKKGGTGIGSRVVR